MQRILGCCIIVPKALLPLSHQIGLAKGCLSPSFGVSQNVLCPLGETWVMAWDSHICLGLPTLSQIWLFLKVRITGLNWNQLLLSGGKKRRGLKLLITKLQHICKIKMLNENDIYEHVSVLMLVPQGRWPCAVKLYLKSFVSVTVSKEQLQHNLMTVLWQYSVGFTFFYRRQRK